MNEPIDRTVRPEWVSPQEWDTGLEIGKLAAQVAEGSPEALRFCVSLSDIALTLDHVTDGDPVDIKRAQAAFFALILDWPLNRFVRDSALALVPVMAGALSAWQASDALPETRVKAYDVITEVWTAVAFILGGWERVNRVMPAVRAACTAQQQFNDSKRKATP